MDKSIQYGSDAFAILVLRLEDLARVVESGVYDIDQAIAGLKELPGPANVPECLVVLGFTEIPHEEELRARYRELVKKSHPDKGGSSEQFQVILKAYQEALGYIGRDE